jgi:peroxiredoxin Q/BCP
MPKVGEKAPDFELLSDEGGRVRLSDFRGKKVVLYFYPKAGTSGWTAQAQGFRDESAKLTAANAVVIGVSPDPPEALAKFRQKNELPFVLLSDPDHLVAGQYGVWGEKQMYGKSYMGIIRSHFVIDEQGRIVDARIKVSPTESVELAVAAVTGKA